MIKELKHYIVYENGDIWSKRKKRFMKQQDNGSGYKKIYMDGWDYVHRVVYRAFLGEIPEEYEIDHKDEDRCNNHKDNLRILTRKENLNRRTMNPLRGKNHPHYGKSMSDEIKQKMSEAKIGKKHPKFKGYYVVDGVKYESAYAAAFAIGTYHTKIIRYCKQKKNGWYFLPI